MATISTERLEATVARWQRHGTILLDEAEIMELVSQECASRAAEGPAPQDNAQLRHEITEWMIATESGTPSDTAQAAIADARDLFTRVLEAAPSPPEGLEQHRCASCGHRWEGPLPGAEYCGDCHRAALKR